MTTTLMPGELLPVADAVLFADGERLALVGFLAGYRGLTRQAYTMDLRLFTAPGGGVQTQRLRPPLP